MYSHTIKRRAAFDAADFAGPVVGQVGPKTGNQNGTGGEPRPEYPAKSFLRTLFGSKGAELFILIWLLSGKLSEWFTDHEEAAEYVEQVQDRDVYVGVALSPADFGPHNRCKAENIAGLVGLWIDLDILNEAHKKKNLPPTIEDALALIPSDLPPSVLIHSGHGLQAWWLFEQPWVFADAKQRNEAALLADRWNALFKQRAAAKGWDVDSVMDFARVLRVPGTTNTKVDGDHRPVRLLEMNERRYLPGELRDYLDRAGVVLSGLAAQARTASPIGAAMADALFVLNPGAEPPFRKFDVLCQVEPRFRASWDHQRPDLQDQSPSAYDQSLANFAARLKWTDQEIVDLLIAHRRKYSVDLKLRADYYRRTIAKAKVEADKYWADCEAEQTINELGCDAADAEAGCTEASVDGSPEGDDSEVESGEPEADGDGEDFGTGFQDARREAQDGPGEAENPASTSPSGTAIEDAHKRRQRILKALSVKFKVPLKRIVKFTGDVPQYRLETGYGDVNLGNVNGLIGQSKLRSSIAACTGKYLPHFDPDEWPGIARLLLSACEDVDRGEDATIKGTLTEWLRTYLDDKPPHEDLAEADAGREPFLSDGNVYIFSGAFRRWLGMRLSERANHNLLTADLRTFGAEPETFNLEIEGKPTTRSAWKLPAGLWAPPDKPSANK